MKRSSKIIALVLAVVMVFLLIPITTVSAAKISGGTVLYLVPSANWNQSNARFAAYFFGDGDAWVSMTKVPGESNVYQVTSPAGKNFTNVIFCRMNPSTSANNWNNGVKWNQTSDLTYNGTSNCYTVKEGTWDKGGGSWSTYASVCAHKNVGAAATCTTSQNCLDCGDPVVEALGHTYNSNHLCTRCNEQATFTVAGSGAHLGTEWDTGNTANDMTYADGVYTKVYTNVAAGSYALKVARDHDWGTAYPSADKAYTVSTAGSTVTVTLKGTAVTVTVTAPHTHSWSDATCTEPQKCSCGETQGEALGHDYVDGVCSRCDALEEGWTVVDSLESLNAALVNGGNIVLNADITSSNVISITTSVVLNGNGHTLTYTGANRAIDVPSTAVDVNLTIKNLTVNTTASFCERGINYNTNGVLTLEKVAVAGTNINYAINLPGSSDNATVVITDSNITGNIALNVWGEKVAVTANNSNFTSPYESEVEVCSVIQFNNDGTTAAHGSSLTVNGGSIISLAETVALSVSSYDTVISISNETTVQGKQETSSIAVIYEGQTQFYTSSSLQHAFDLAANDPRAKVLLLGDVILDAPVVVTGTVVLDLNGFELSYTSTTMGEAMITNKGNLTINDSVGTGVINYNYVGANDASYGKGNYTISNAGTLTVNGGKITIANLRSHAKYPIDNNSTTGDAILVINGGHLYNYNTAAIRMFCNSTTYKNSVTINGGLVEGYSAIWMQNPGNKTVHGALTITGGEIRTTAAAYVNGTASVKEVSSSLYTSIDGNGGAWTADSLVSITGGTLNENVNVYYEAPENVTIGAATFNGNVWFVCKHVWADATCTAPKTCSVCGETEGEALGHVDTNPCDHECDVCGLSVTACQDENKDHKCDICKDVMSKCSDDDKNHFCDVCGVQNSHCIDIPPYDHNCDWCGAKVSEHNFVEGKCDVCGEEDPNYVPPHVHSWSEATCTEPSKCECGETNGEALGHKDAAPLDHECDACGLAISECKDDNKNHKCDICNDVMSTCSDDDKNHFCDVCGVQNSHCIDIPPYDHNCDWCGAKVSEHAYEAVVTAPTCTAAGYTTYTCACGHTYTGNEVAALGHAWENCACTGCGTVLPTLTQNESFQFSTQANYDAVVASGKLGFVGTFRDNGGSFQFNTNSTIQFVAPANTTITVTGHSAQYGVFNIYLNGEKAELTASNGIYKFTVTEETKVVIATGDEGASYSYIKGITLEAFIDRTIASDVEITFGSEGNYKDSIVDFSGIQIGDNGGSNSQVKNGSFNLELKAGAVVTIHGYPGYTSYKLNDGEAIESEYYTYIALTDTVLTVTPVSGNNYFYSISVKFHEGVALVEAKDPTCTEAGYGAHYVCDCHDEPLTDKGEIAALGHDYKYDVCACGEVDPAYASVTHRINFSTWETFDKETYADGTVVKYNDVFSFIYSKNAKVDGSSKTWDDFAGTLRFSFGTKTPTGKVPNKGAIQITVDGAYTIKLWYVAGGDARYFALLDENGTVLAETTKETVKNGQGYAELIIPAAGVYYLGTPADNNYLFQIELVKHEHTAGAEATCTTAQTCTTCGAVIAEALGHTFVYGKCTVCGEADPDYVPYVNTLVVGDTNKIVVDGDTFNDYNLPIEWVAFVADEKAEYTFVGNNGALVFIFDAELNLLCGGTGKATLEAGTYLICIGNGVVGELNVAVTKTLLEVPHEHEFSDATCTEPSKCECGETQGEALGHDFKEGTCTRCDAVDPEYVPDQGGDDVTDPEPQPQPEMNFFQMIIDFFKKLFEMIMNLFK